jgi:transcriptional regulator CtsR
VIWGGVISRKIKEFLDEPSNLKYDTTAPGYIELCNRTKGGYRIERIRHVRSEKALQSLVQRLRNNIKTRHSAYADDLDILRNIYSQYCWQSLGQSGFSDSEASMLASLISDSMDQKKGGRGNCERRIDAHLHSFV